MDQEVRNLCAVICKFKSGGVVYSMKGMDKSREDYHDLVSISKAFAKMGREVFILSPVHYKDPNYALVFGNLIGTRYYRKCPDLLVDGLYFEYESYKAPWTKRKVSHMLSSGMKQSSRLIINNNKGASDRHIRKLIQARLHLNAPLDEVWIYEKGEIRLIYKKQQGGKLLPAGQRTVMRC